MSIWMIVKVFSDACVIFGILGAFPTVLSYSYSLLIPALLCGIGVGIAASVQDAGMGRLRWLGAVLALSWLYFAPAGEKMILIPVIGYALMVIFRGQFRLEYYGYRDIFKQSLLVLGALYIILSMFSYLERVSNSDIRTMYAEVVLRYGIVHLITGVILLRQLRLGLTRTAQGSRGQIAAILTGTGGVILGFLAAEPYLRKGATSVLNSLLSIVAGAVMAVYNLITMLVDQVEVQKMQEQVQEIRQEGGIPAMGPVFQQIMEKAEQGSEETSNWWVFLVIILVVIVMALMLKSFRKHGSESMTHEIVETIAPPKQEQKESRRSNRGKVRHYYREFLRMEKKRGLKLRKDLTTEDILNRISADTNEAAASELRRLYIQARYNRNCEVTREQADAAKSALKRSRGGTT